MKAKKPTVLEMLIEQRQGGRKDVVEWIESNLIGGTENYLALDGRKWQTQKKDWGL